MRYAFVIAICVSAWACSPSSASAPAESKAALPTVSLTEKGAFPLDAHVESADIASGKYTFERMQKAGSALFHTAYNGMDGVGIAVRPNGTHVARFAPLGPAGPAAQSCGECHNAPIASAGGLAHSSVVRDTVGKGVPPFDVRAATSLLGDGILQLLAQEMTEELQAARSAAADAAKATPGKPVTRELKSKGTNFGSITATATAGGVTFDVSKVAGLDPDLVVRPMGWKGDDPMVRNIVVFASALGMGMQPEEFIAKTPGADPKKDADGDGVSRELSVGDVTAMTIYTASLETPSEVAQLASLGYVHAMSADDKKRVDAGRALFTTVGCASCHTPEMTLTNTRFEEPTLRGNGNFYDQALAKLDPNYDPKRPFAFDILTDAKPPRAEARQGGGATIRLYGDLKRHAMGRLLADHAEGESDGGDGDTAKYEGKPIKIPADHFLTAELWGVGNTGPYLHDNRAGTLREAILLHGEDQPPARGEAGRSEAQESRDQFKGKSADEQDSLIAFLLSLRSFSPPQQ
jgi:mono/diheme cytochrome c family protein